MSSRTTAAALCVPLALLLLAPTAQAQDAAPTFMVSYQRCDRSRLEEVVDRERTRGLPISQSLVDDGTIWGFGLGVHQWGDEWNVIRWTIVPDLPAGLAAYDEGGRRFEAAHPNDDGALDRALCPAHRDVFYQQVASTTDNPSVNFDPENPPTLALSYFQCDFGALEDIVAQERSMVIPVAQELVNERLMMSQSYYVHTWGDEWNYVVARIVPNLAALDSTAEELDERLDARYSEDDGADLVGQHCTAHKDNIYTFLLATTPRATE